MGDKIKLSKKAHEMILKIEQEFLKIQSEENTNNALNFLQEIIDYLRSVYIVK